MRRSIHIYLDVARSRDKDFEENKHPRDRLGKFSSASSHGPGGRTHESGSGLPAHIKALKIPPAWTDVRYSEDPDSDLQAVGKDAKGREQRIYSARFAGTQAEAKFRRIEELNKKVKDIEDKNLAATKDPKKRNVADALSLVMGMGIRPGSETDTGAEAKAYGATTLEGRHVVANGDDVRLKFVGKKGVPLDLPVTDKRLASMLKRRANKAGPDGKLFPGASPGKLLSHVKSLSGSGFKTKDFRTLLGTRIAQQLVSQHKKPPRTESEYKKAVRDVAKQVSSTLGNTPTVALQSYIAPEVFAGWRARMEMSTNAAAARGKRRAA